MPLGSTKYNLFPLPNTMSVPAIYRKEHSSLCHSAVSVLKISNAKSKCLGGRHPGLVDLNTPCKTTSLRTATALCLILCSDVLGMETHLSFSPGLYISDPKADMPPKILPDTELFPPSYARSKITPTFKHICATFPLPFSSHSKVQNTLASSPTNRPRT
jgi:hypothetical protein